MLEGVAFEMSHDPCTEATPSHVSGDMNARQLADVVRKKPDAAAADSFLVGNGDDQDPVGKDEVVAWELSHCRIDFGGRGRARPVATYDVLPVRPQRVLSKYRPGIRGNQSRKRIATRAHAYILPPCCLLLLTRILDQACGVLL